ncbi:hypothetical protein MN608_03350 [Microdochium nivale]|nr:hypothetical protein MN608_03350 [Microdochium nivale]
MPQKIRRHEEAKMARVGGKSKFPLARGEHAPATAAPFAMISSMTVGGKEHDSGAEMNTIPWLVRLRNEIQSDEGKHWHIVMCGGKAGDESLSSVTNDISDEFEDWHISGLRT